DGHRRTEELVDRGPDHNDDLIRPLENRAIGAHLEAAGRQELGQQLVSTGFLERHLTGRDLVEGGLADVVDSDAEARLGEGEAQWEPDVAAAPEDHDVEFRRHGGTVAARCGPDSTLRSSCPWVGTTFSRLPGAGSCRRR